MARSVILASSIITRSVTYFICNTEAGVEMGRGGGRGHLYLEGEAEALESRLWFAEEL